MTDTTLTDRITADAAYAAAENSDVDLMILLRLHLRLCEREGACPEFFKGASKLLPDIIADLEHMKSQATEAVEIYEAARAYGERPRYALVTEGGASI